MAYKLIFARLQKISINIKLRPHAFSTYRRTFNDSESGP